MAHVNVCRVEPHPSRLYNLSSAYVEKESYDYCAWNRSYADAPDDETSEGGLGAGREQRVSGPGEGRGPGGRGVQRRRGRPPGTRRRKEILVEEEEEEDEDEDEDEDDDQDYEEEEQDIEEEEDEGEAEKWDVEEVLNERRQEVQKLTEEAHKDRQTMLRRLGLVNSEGLARTFRGQHCNVPVSREYVIDRWDSQRSMMRVNYEHTLSLRAEVVGLFLGIDFIGPIPDQRTSQGKFEELEEFILEEKKKRQYRTGTFRGLSPDSLEPRLRTYIRKRRPMLGFTNSDRQLPQTQVYAFKEELYSNKRFNWVASRVLRVETLLARSGRKCKLSHCLKDFLAYYIGAALSYQRAGREPGSGADNSVDNVKAVRASGRREGLGLLGVHRPPGGSSRRLEQHSTNTLPGQGHRDSVWMETWKQHGIKRPKREFPDDDVAVQVEVELGDVAAGKIRRVEHQLHLGNRIKDLEREFNVEKAKNSVIVSRITNLEAQREMEILQRNRAEMMAATNRQQAATDLKMEEEPSSKQVWWVLKVVEKLKAFVR